MDTTDASTSAPLDRHELDRLLAALGRERHIPGLSLAVTSSAGLLAAASAGHADLAARRPATPETPYLWFSLTKVATATAAMAMADRGVVDLDAPVTTYLPRIGPAGTAKEVRVVQLLNHTAGLANPLPLRWIRPAGAAPPDADALLDEVLRRRRAWTASPGGPARYSNLGFLVLAQVLSAVAGRPFVDVLTDEVLRPLGMARTGFTHRPGTATGYVRAPRPAGALLRAYLPAGTVGARHGRHVALAPFVVEGAGYGGLVGDVVDAARLAQLHLANGLVGANRLLSPATARRMRTVAWPGHPFDLGLGWFRKPACATAPEHVEHLGAGGGFHNAMRIYPDLDLGFVVMANTTRAYDHHHLFERLRRLPWRT